MLFEGGWGGGKRVLDIIQGGSGGQARGLGSRGARPRLVRPPALSPFRPRKWGVSALASGTVLRWRARFRLLRRAFARVVGALAAGPAAHMVTVADRADRYPPRTHRPRPEQVARRPRRPRSFVAGCAGFAPEGPGACHDVCNSPRKVVVKSIEKVFLKLIHHVAAHEPLRHACTHARHITRNTRHQTELTDTFDLHAPPSAEEPSQLRHMPRRA